MKKFLLGFLGFIVVLVALLFGNRLYLLRGNDAYKYHSVSGLTYVAKTEGKQFRIYDGHETWAQPFLVGVNLGSGKPGYFPGEFPITREDYLRWFRSISAMNVNMIRVYTAQMPVFYQALSQFNASAEHPLYLMQGIYLNEADIAELHDAYAQNGKIKEQFLTDIRNIIDIIHGHAKIAKEPGNAYGTYAADVSRYVIGWILGIEWEAPFVSTTNANNPQYTAYDGQYIYTPEGVTPFEVMLAEAADTAIAYETEHYREQRPVAMANWVTSDPLRHPGEPNPETEDSVSVDMDNLLAKPGFEAGLFASYHVYPYYPDMFNYDLDYIEKGRGNTYRAYLEELNAHHRMPVLISEVGVPSSRGIAHENILSGANQGHLTETEQGEILTALIGDIYDLGLSGAVVFSWQDEWFKKSWNTQEFDLEQRRPYWMDYQTTEQSYGLLAFEPGEEASVCQVDGDPSEWLPEHFIGQAGDYRLSMMSDEKFLYLLLDAPKFGELPLYLPIDIIPGQGNTRFAGTALGLGADFLLVLDGKERSTVLVDPYYDPTYYLHAVLSRNVWPREPAREKKDTGRFVPITQLLSRPLTHPQTGERLPLKTADTGHLRYGTTDPNAEAYDSLADFCADASGKIEIRLPWLLLNIADPSSGKILGDFYAHQGFTWQDAPSIKLGVFPADAAQAQPLGEYAWPRWDMPTSHERLKTSYYILQQTFSAMDNIRLRAKTPFERFWASWNEASFSRVARWFPVQPFLNYMIAFFLAIMFYFFFSLLFLHISSIARARKAERIKRLISAATEGEALPIGKRHAVAGLRRPFAPPHLLILSSLLNTLGKKQQQHLCQMLNNAGFEKHAANVLRRRNVENLILIIRMLGQVGNAGFNQQIVGLLYAHPAQIDLAYQGLLTLALTGDGLSLAAICMDQRYRQTLSFRSLQEIFRAFDGDKQRLYGQLLDAPDRFIVRICIKRIGAESLTELVPRILPRLEDTDYNVVIDTIRTLGQLRWANAAERLCALTHHEKWEVRGVAVSALAAIDAERYAGEIAEALHDREWQVRYNAAMALCATSQIADITNQVKQSGDRYALEILQYATVMQNL